jgi:hypothetical protein
MNGAGRGAILAFLLGKALSAEYSQVHTWGQWDRSHRGSQAVSRPLPNSPLSTRFYKRLLKNTSQVLLHDLTYRKNNCRFCSNRPREMAVMGGMNGADDAADPLLRAIARLGTGPPKPGSSLAKLSSRPCGLSVGPCGLRTWETEHRRRPLLLSHVFDDGLDPSPPF